WVYGRAAAEAYACDAQLVPVVTGHLDPAALDAAAGRHLAGFRRPDCACGGCTCPPGPGVPGAGGSPGWGGPPGASTRPGGPPPLSPRARRQLQDTLLACAADLLSGPAGLAAFLRTELLENDFPATASLPLDTGTPTAAVPPHLRRLVILRDRHCAFPGCRQKPLHCQAHHLIPRAKGGVTALHNLTLLCSFHHLIAVHRWGWTLALNPDGTTTATSPDSKRVLHSHGPPGAAAAAA
ncbi:MAG TPA: HNH endonuclease signature motif containing protein, partial [Streptosporangiaceae bacterium]